MARIQKSTALYPHPFSKAYWKDAAAELKDMRMLVISALLIALRIALKPAAIPLGPSLYIQTATLATALGAMIFGPVVAVPAAIISDTIGFMIWPTGDYFLPFVLTEIGSTMIYALFLYRARVSTIRVMLARFGICFFINCVLQQVIYAWQYTFLGNPDAAKDAIMGIMTVTRIFKNLALFPIETVVMTLFLQVLLPVCRRMNLIYCPDTELKFQKKQIIALVLLVVVGIGLAGSYLTYRYENTSRTADYKAEEVVEMNKKLHTIITGRTETIDKGNTVAVIEYAEKPFLGNEITYTVAIYEAKEGCSITEKMWSLKKTPASKHEDLSRLATVTVVTDNKTETIKSYEIVFVR